MLYLSLGSSIIGRLSQNIHTLHLILRPLKGTKLLLFIPYQMLITLLLETPEMLIGWTLLHSSWTIVKVMELFQTVSILTIGICDGFGAEDAVNDT